MAMLFAYACTISQHKFSPEYQYHVMGLTGSDLSCIGIACDEL